MFIYALGRAGAITTLTQRAHSLEAEIAKIHAYQAAIHAQNLELPRIFAIEEEFAQALRRAELDWVRRRVAALQDGSLPWPVLLEDEEEAR
jgi:hypothetical protein